jgi:hypothetical protein
MPTQIPESVKNVEKLILDAIRNGEDAVVKTVGSWVEAGRRVAPNLFSLPYPEQLPAPAEVIDHVYDLIDEFVASQRTFAKNLLGAVQPVLAVSTTSTPSVKAAPKAAAA